MNEQIIVDKHLTIIKIDKVRNASPLKWYAMTHASSNIGSAINFHSISFEIAAFDFSKLDNVSVSVWGLNGAIAGHISFSFGELLEIEIF